MDFYKSAAARTEHLKSFWDMWEALSSGARRHLLVVNEEDVSRADFTPLIPKYINKIRIPCSPNQTSHSPRSMLSALLFVLFCFAAATLAVNQEFLFSLQKLPPLHERCSINRLPYDLSSQLQQNADIWHPVTLVLFLVFLDGTWPFPRPRGERGMPVFRGPID